MNDLTALFGGPIHAYTRAQAIADGVLIDVSKTAREAGIVFPVALTGAVWEECVRVPPDVECQDQTGRLGDVLWMFRCAASRAQGDTTLFRLHVHNDNRDRTPPLVTLKAVLGLGDHGEPVLTIMQPNED